MKKISILLITLGCLLGLNMSLSAQSTGTENGHEWVDLGLPSGLRWATCNVGAKTPEQSGNYYAWGETKPKDTYYQSNSLTYDKQMDDISGNAQYDAATVNWGGDWRMPTKTEMTELINNCTWEWTKQNGVRGYKVTGPNDNSIFLPAAGFFSEGWFNSGSCGDDSRYWSSTPYEDGVSSAYYLCFGSEDRYMYGNVRYSGRSVRPVRSRVGIETPCVTASVVEFTDITAIIKTYATDGGAEITERGFYWGTNPNPSETDNKVVLENEVEWITNVLLNLTPNTTYYVKAYATNSEGTSYSEVVSFTTLAESAYNEYVDLGLPSGLKWATCNVGANSPEEYGNYYAWGEVVTKTDYSSSNCPTYGLTTSQLHAQGYIDGEGNLNPQYDAATANWGGNWRLPTKAEMQELIDNCTWEWTTQYGVKGYKVTSKTNGNSIFLPAAGYRNGSSLSNAGNCCHYWSSAPVGSSDNGAYNLYSSIYSSSSAVQNVGRDCGRPVRPVLE